MLNLIRDIWQSLADVFLGLADGALDVLATLYAAMCALPLPIAVMACAAGVALFHAIDQRAARRNNR